MVTITLCMRQQKRHWCIDQSYRLCRRGRGWEDLGEWHWNMYNIIYETSRQSRFDAWYWMLGAGALGWPRGRVWGGSGEEGSGWGTHVYLWQIHFHIWQKQYNIVKFKNKIKFKKKERKWKDNVPVLILSSKYGVYFYSWCLWYFWPPSGEEHASGGWCPFSLGLRKRNERTIARKEAWSIYKPIQTNTSINCELTGAS